MYDLVDRENRIQKVNNQIKPIRLEHPIPGNFTIAALCGRVDASTEPVAVSATIIKMVLDDVIDFVEQLTLSGDLLIQAGQLLRDVEDLRGEL